MEEITKPKRVFCVGDIHGANKALIQVLEMCEFDYEKDTLISLGDIADGWSEVPECVETLLKIKNLVAIRGNHDVWLRDWLKSGYVNPMWLPQGGQASYDAYVKTAKIIDQKHKDFFENQIDYYIDEQNNLYTHAGWDYGWDTDFLKAGLYPVNGGNPSDNIAKECHWSREIYFGLNSHKEGKIPLKLKEAISTYNEIYIGHTATRFPYLVFHKENVYNMDTGGGWHGKLSIMNVDTKEIFQSELVRNLYPEEKGR